MLMVWLLVVLMQTPEVHVSSHPYVPQYTVHVDTKVVEVAAVVRDSHDRVVSGLTKEDFRLLDDGKPREIEHFVADHAPQDASKTPRAPASVGKIAVVAAQTRFLAVFIDDVNSTDAALANGLRLTQTAAKKFVAGAFNGDVRIGLFTASGQQNVEFTTDEAKLIEAISAVRAHVKMREDGLTKCPRITPYLAFRISSEHDQASIRAVIFDAAQHSCSMPPSVILAQADETWRIVQEMSTDTLNAVGRVVVHLESMPGRRELLLASSGFLAAPQEELKNKIIDRALRAGVVINALDAKGIYSEAQPGVRPQDGGFTETLSGSTAGANAWIRYETTEMPVRLQALSEPMGTLAAGTGGVFFHNNNDLNAGFRELGNAPEVIYRMTFRPEGAVDGSYHKLKIVVNGKNHSVQARPGYFVQASEESLQTKIDREILAEDTKQEIPVQIAVEQSGANVSVVLHVDISKLRFVQQDDRRVQHILFTTALVDAQGKIAAAKEGEMDLALTEATFKGLLTSGLKAIVHLPVSAGPYKLRQVSAETVDGKLACSTQALQVR